MARCGLILVALLVTACATGEEASPPASPDGRLFVKVLRDGAEPVVSLDLATGRQVVVPYSRLAGGDPPFHLAISSGFLVFNGARDYSLGQGVYTTYAGRPG